MALRSANTITHDHQTRLHRHPLARRATRAARRAHSFCVDTLGLCPDEHGQFEFWAGQTCFGIWDPERLGSTFSPQENGHIAPHVDDIDRARADLEAKGVEFIGETFDTGVCKMAFFNDPDGNDLMLQRRYAPVGQRAGQG